MPTRWCPTAEQLMILEEMYKGGLRTPNASQIQKITAHLSFYGIIEGKNVFYWFQNHKARDRQKLRRKFTKQLQDHNHNHNHNHNLHYYYYSQNYNASINQQPSSSSSFDLHQPLDDHKSSPQGDDDWMMMALKEACGTSHCCNKSKSIRPLKTLQLFPIKATTIKEEEQQCSTSSIFRPENVPNSSSITLDISSSMYK